MRASIYVFKENTETRVARPFFSGSALKFHEPPNLKMLATPLLTHVFHTPVFHTRVFRSELLIMFANALARCFSRSHS